MRRKPSIVLRLGALVICALLLLAGGPSMEALAAGGTVTYDGEARSFIFEPGSDDSPTDLFDGLKDVMPGDTLTQTITVKNTASDSVQIHLYLRSLGATEEAEAFLSQLTLTVEAEDGATLFDAPADQTAGLTDWADLGTLDAGGTATLNLTLSVPLEMGNSYQEAVGAIGWEFKAEEIPVETSESSTEESASESASSSGSSSGSDSSSGSSSGSGSSSSSSDSSGTGTASSVKTGDTSQMGMWTLILILSAAGLAVLLLCGRRKKTKEE